MISHVAPTHTPGADSAAGASRSAQRNESGSRGEDSVIGGGPLFALVLWPSSDPQLSDELHSLGVAVSFAPTQQIFQAVLSGLSPELLVIDPDTLNDVMTLAIPAQSSLIVLAAITRGTIGEPIPSFVHTALARSVAHARVKQLERHAHARQAQLERERQLSTVIYDTISA